MTEAERKELQTTLDIYGGDVSRWPMDVRRRLSSRIADDADAREMFERAGQLDGFILAATPSEDVTAMAIAARVATKAAASSNASTAEPADNVVVMQPRQVEMKPASWAVAAALAASLAIGLFAGQSGWIDPAIATIAGLEQPQSETDGLLGDQLLVEEDVI